MQGYRPSWSYNNTVLTCVTDEPISLPIWVRPITIGLSVTGFLLLASVALMVWLRVTIQLRRKWHRDNELTKNRAKGVPNGGPASIVVTDVEGYSELMQQNPIVTTRAMGVHNAILRKVVTAHAGHVIEQEGDSWSVAFHRPIDAVAFCLQVQQALQRSHWPAELYATTNPKASIERHGSVSSIISELGGGMADDTVHKHVGLNRSGSGLEKYTPTARTVSGLGTTVDSGFREPGLLLRSGSCSKAIAEVEDMQPKVQPTGNETQSGSTANAVDRPGEILQRISFMAGWVQQLTGQGRNNRRLSKEITTQAQAGRSLSGAGKIPQSSAAGTLVLSAPGTTQHNHHRAVSMTQQNTAATSAAQQNLQAPGKPHSKKQRRASQESATSSDRGSSYTQATSQRERTGSITWVSQGRKGGKAAAGVVRGLKIRMGVVSGWIPADTDIIRSPLFMLAKAVSDMANGGQILVECWTAEAVRELLTELGSVDHKGYNDKLLLRAQREDIRYKAHTACRWLGSCFSTAIKIATRDRDAVLLNMGQIWVPSLVSTLQAVAAANAAHSGGRSLLSAMSQTIRGPFDMSRQATHVPLRAAPKPLLQLHGSTAAVAAAATAAINGAAALGPSSMGLQLYSIFARPLHGRCMVWKGNLKLPQGAQPVAKGYFDAPGTVMATLSPATTFLDMERPLLPPVTMVFACVEAGKVLVRKRERVAAIVHNVITRTMQALLLSLPDGYLCREQDATLKYMVAFREPARAAEWCILMQDVLQPIPWSTEVVEGLASLAARPSASSSGGRATSSTAGLVGRPRLKMGLAEGVPDEIAPDHLGRADYFGNSVNLAARIMSTAAHAGQVAISLEMAQGVFSSWRYEAEVGLCSFKTGQLQTNQQPGVWHNAFSSPAEGTAEVTGPASPTAATAAVAATSNLVQPSGQGSAQQAEPEAVELKLSSSQTQHHGYDAAARHSAMQFGEQLSEQWLATVQAGCKDGPAALLEPVACKILSSSGADMNTIRMSAALGGSAVCRVTIPSFTGTPDSSNSNLVHVSCNHIGTFAFKGCGAMDMVCLISDAMLAEATAQPRPPPKGAKGTLIVGGTGPVVGLQGCPVTLPNVMADFRQAWASMITNSPQPAEIAYARWVKESSREAAAAEGTGTASIKCRHQMDGCTFGM